ncbi:related to NADH-ubiquinone oxidoreductase 21 kDa subunit [Armillaria ostoyae]|uniref:Related to NADH-ubiquinone oxidoreductase 21 kDa subunit n=1 Tax=Armillaria ostoyae TaxID=47428 RepID=A0A284R5J6_ARMOS|nr:related to NADH-ubiquinone oxidoreductase 21 kDa subunit [Armillaria ostoyae]
MPEKVVETAYPVIDSDPHAYRVVRYMRPSDFGAWAAVTAAFPAAFFAWGTGYSLSLSGFKGVYDLAEMADPSAMTQKQLRLGMRGAGILGLFGGFLFAYQRSSLRFFGMSENKREEELDLQELTQRAKEGKSLYGESPQPQWVQSAAHQNSVWSQFKFSAIPMFNLVNHPYHGTDPAKYGVTTEDTTSK